MTQAVEAVNEGAEVSAVAGAHLFVGTKEFLQPEMEGLVALAYGGYLSLREEGIARRDAPADIPVVRPGRGDAA